MKRRTLLASLAGTTAAIGTAGCLQSFGSDPGTKPGRGPTKRPPSERPSESTTTGSDDARDTNALDPEWDPAGGPVESFAVGDRDAVAFPNANRPHGLTFWNRVDREREVSVEVASGATDVTETLGPVAVPAGYTFEVSLRVPTRYALGISVDADAFGTVIVGREHFDCNHSGTSYALGDTDVVDYGTESTLVYCTRPAVAATSVDVDDRGCANDAGGDATVRYDGERVTVDGTFVASNPCHDLAVGESSYDDETNTAHVVLDATHPEDQACQDCVGALYYRATVDFDHDLPDRVAVHHRDADGDAVRVATATRNAGR
ncbi:hypothetical protein [Halorubellus sp. PRR65]|uniref:hypothetical protein n=1 Tax=Halorubellus sp. PRR65 TaxID=3098148 RepID=UPI002B25E459|nr:hypothetical protein [Halorubellus sp. PRR65]